MSRATELVELEAQRTEAELAAEVERQAGEQGEQGDGEHELEQQGEQGEPEPEPEPELEPSAPAVAPATGEPAPKQLRELDREQQRHEAAVLRIMGGFVAGFVACESCGGVGLVPPGDPPPEPRSHEWFRGCETCAGFGRVLTGSLREPYNARDCPKCLGRGYEEALSDAGVPLAPADGQQAGAPPMAQVPAGELEHANGNGSAGEPRFGTPAWMGDTSIGS